MRYEFPRISEKTLLYPKVCPKNVEQEKIDYILEAARLALRR